MCPEVFEREVTETDETFRSKNVVTVTHKTVHYMVQLVEVLAGTQHGGR